jgi:hypothetical protein
MKQKKRIQARRMLFHSLSYPAQRQFSFGVFTFLHFVILVAGFAICQKFFVELDDSLNDVFDASLFARRTGYEAVRLIHGVVLANEKENQTLFDEMYQKLNENNALLSSKVIPFIAQQETYTNDAFRGYIPVMSNSSTALLDQSPKNINTLELMYSLMRASSLALGYSRFGQLNVAFFLGIPELRFLIENMEIVITSIHEVPGKAISSFFSKIASDFVLLWIFLVINLLILLAFFWFANWRV